MKGLTHALAAVMVLLGGCGGGGDPQTSQSTGGVSANTANLAWDPVPDPNVRGYRIYYGTGPGTYQQAYGNGLDVGSTITYSVSGLNRATRYYFVATAYDAMGNESGFSNEVFKDIP